MMRKLLPLLSALLASATLAQPLVVPAPSTEVDDDIVITGRRPDQSPLEITLDFVKELGDPVSSNFGFARLENDLCIKVHNVAPQAGEYFVERMSVLAGQLGMQRQEPDCKPNLDIIFTTDGKAMAAHLRDKQPELLRPFGNVEGTTQGLHALEEFTSSEAPVRWWQITIPVDRIGNIAVKLPGSESAPTVPGANSHLSSGVRGRLLGTLVIVDIEKVGEATWDQIADYVSMVAMAQVDPKTSLAGYDSILNLFGSGKSTPALTAWDKAYLQALYSINLHMMPGSQNGQLANALLRKLEE